MLIKEEGVAFRGLFIINEKGIVRHMSVNDTPVGRSVDEALRLVQGFQYTDKHGEVVSYPGRGAHFMFRLSKSTTCQCSTEKM